MREIVIGREKSRHKDSFPISDNLMSLVFLVQADLGEQQRERFVASMSLRQMDMQGYTYLRVKQLFLDLFCSTATSTADPLIRRHKRTTFLVLDEGEYEDETGYWVMDQATQEEGFVSLFSETNFWVLGAKGGYTKRKIHGREFRKGPKGGKGNRGKGRRRPGFRSRKGKGAFAATEENYDWDWNNSTFYNNKGGKGKGKGKGQGKWHFPQKGKHSDAYKGNFKGKGKGKNSKGDANVAQGSQAGEPSQAHIADATEEDWSAWEANPTQTVWYQEGNAWYSCTAEEAAMWNSGYGYVVHGRTDQTDQEPAGQRNLSQETGSTQHDATHRHSDDFEPHSSCEQHSSFLNYDNCSHHALLSEYIDLRWNPTYVILDSGCTRAMGSKYAIDRLVRACQNHPNADLVYFTREPSQSRFSFANGQQSSVHEKLIIHFRNDDSPTGWVTTAVDILDQGDVPILFSVAQMRNLRMNIEHTPACDFLTCSLFGMKRYPLPARSKKKPVHGFHSDSSYVTCPACQGKHRAHTYKDGCRRAASEESKPIATPKPKPKAKTATDPDIKIDISTKPEVKEEPKPSKTQPSKLISMPAPKKQDSSVKFDQSTLRQDSDWHEPFRHSNNPSSSSAGDRSKPSDPAPHIAPKSETPVPSVKPEITHLFRQAPPTRCPLIFIIFDTL